MRALDALKQADEPRLAGFDLEGLEARARAQQEGIEEQRREAARIALSAG